MTVTRCFLWMLEAERLLFRLALVQMVLGILYAMFCFLRFRRDGEKVPTILENDWPHVTVQLPIRNEFYVADRVIRAAAALDYPNDRIEIQVLDDSDDETVALVDSTVEELRESGVQIRTIRRSLRTGFKAGHLALGLESARGEFLASFDADFIPPSDFLRRTIPIFRSDETVGMVQGRWEFLNQSSSFLTWVQATILNGLMLIDQPIKSRRRNPFQFNGTAGVWRKTCIEDAGGWRGDSMVEDLDLSYRAFMKHWRFVDLPDLAVPTELPDTMMAYRAQQRRWTRGNAQMLRALGPKVLMSDLKIGHRAGMMMHLGGRLIYLLLAVLTVTMPLITFGWIHPLVNYPLAQDGALLAAVMAALLLFYVPAQLMVKESFVRAVCSVPMVVSVNIGLSLCCATAFLSGLFSRRSVFVRTPKVGAHGGGSTGPRYHAPFDPLCLVETIVGTAYVFFTRLAVMRGREYFVLSLFFAFFAFSFLWVGLTSLFGSFETVSGRADDRRKAGELTRRLLAYGRRPKVVQGHDWVVNRLGTEFHRLRRNGTRASLFIVEIPFDRAQIDLLLVLLHGSLRPYDLAVGIDGSKLALLLLDTEAAEDQNLLTRVAKLLPSQGWTRAIGAAHGPLDPEDTPERMFARAASRLIHVESGCQSTLSPPVWTADSPKSTD